MYVKEMREEEQFSTEEKNRQRGGGELSSIVVTTPSSSPLFKLLYLIHFPLLLPPCFLHAHILFHFSPLVYPSFSPCL